MNSYQEFYQMAYDILNDPDIRSSAQVVVSETVALDPNKPWEKTSSNVNYDVNCFYSKQKNTLVNGAAVQTGQKVVLFQLAVPEAYLMTASWKDANGKEWAIKQLESVELNDSVIMFKAIIGV